MRLKCSCCFKQGNGSFDEEIEQKPLIRVSEAMPDCPLPAVVCTPAEAPASTYPTLVMGRGAKSLASILVAEPVNEFFLAVPKVVITTSSRLAASGSSFILKVV